MHTLTCACDPCHATLSTRVRAFRMLRVARLEAGVRECERSPGDGVRLAFLRLALDQAREALKAPITTYYAKVR